jgi:hypothetical protein
MRRPDNVKVGDRFVVNASAKRNNSMPKNGSTLNAGDVVTCVGTDGNFTLPSQEGLVVALLWSELEGPYEEALYDDDIHAYNDWEEALRPTQDMVMLRLIKASPETALLLIKELSA